MCLSFCGPQFVLSGHLWQQEHEGIELPLGSMVCVKCYLEIVIPYLKLIFDWCLLLTPTLYSKTSHNASLDTEPLNLWLHICSWSSLSAFPPPSPCTRDGSICFNKSRPFVQSHVSSHICAADDTCTNRPHSTPSLLPQRPLLPTV